MDHVFIIGSKGIPAAYGGFESFVDKLTAERKSNTIQYHVACMGENEKEYVYNDARCFCIKTPSIGSAKAVFYDITAMCACIKYISKNQIKDPQIYILACRIGPFIGRFKHKLAKYNGKIYINPDGHEWLRAKWNRIIKAYWKFSERLMIKYGDLIICDSTNIESYILKKYRKYSPKTRYIAYGAEVQYSDICNTDMLQSWFEKNELIKEEYYLLVGRFVPENNYLTILQEFMATRTHKKLVIISNIENNKFYNELLNSTHFDEDKRIKFVGTVYDTALLCSIRSNAFAYIHGHEVGGTNPSLLESLATTKINLLLDVVFNREVGGDCAYYWLKEKGSLSTLIDQVEQLPKNDCIRLGESAKQRIQSLYSWDKIVKKYEDLFLEKEVSSDGA